MALYLARVRSSEVLDRAPPSRPVSDVDVELIPLLRICVFENLENTERILPFSLETTLVERSRNQEGAFRLVERDPMLLEVDAMLSILVGKLSARNIYHDR